MFDTCNKYYILSDKELDIYFVSDYYDFPLEGLCWINYELHSFTILDDSFDDLILFYKCEKLSFGEKLEFKFSKKMFELLCNYHWSHDIPEPIRNNKVSKISKIINFIGRDRHTAMDIYSFFHKRMR